MPLRPSKAKQSTSPGRIRPLSTAGSFTGATACSARSLGSVSATSGREPTMKASGLESPLGVPSLNSCSPSSASAATVTSRLTVSAIAGLAGLRWKVASFCRISITVFWSSAVHTTFVPVWAAPLLAPPRRFTAAARFSCNSLSFSFKLFICCGVSGLTNPLTIARNPVPEIYALVTPSRNCPPSFTSKVVPCLPPAGYT